MTVEAISTTSDDLLECSEDKETGDLNGRDVEIQKHKDNAVEKITEFVKENVITGATVGGVIIGGAAAAGVIIAPILIYDTSKKLIEACKEYEEAVILENESMGLDKFGNPVDNENDRDSWDKDY